MSFGDYLLGCGGVVVIAVSLGFAAILLRRRLLPDWTGAPAHLATSILAIGLLTLLLELLGVAARLDGAQIVGGSVAIALGVWLVDRRGGGRGPARRDLKTGLAVPAGGPPAPAPAGIAAKWQLAIAIAVTLLLFAQWSMPTFLSLDRGIYGGDSLWYHLPFAAGFAESGSITALHFTDPLYLNWFYPQNSELVHAAGITLFGNDFLSPLINLGWLGLALLAAWCIGRPWRAGAISLTGVAILLAADLMFSRQPGNANNDIVGLALLLGAIAILTTTLTAGGRASAVTGTRAKGSARAPAEDRTHGPGTALAGPLAAIAVAGLAAGLALGTKLTFLVPVAALTIGVIAIAAKGMRRATTVTWSVPLLLGGGFWYARNLVVAGNPLPWQKLGVGPIALPRSEALEGRDPFSIAHYATDTGVWRHYFFPGLNERFGDLWPLLLALAALGVVLALVRGGRLERMLAAVAVITTVAYLLTPLSASGPEGAPLGFRLNLRYLAPALAIGLVLLAAPSARLRGRERASAIAVLGVLMLVLLAGHSPLAALDDGYLLGALVVAAAAGAAVALALLADRGAPRAAVVGAALSLVVLVTLGWPEQRDYTDQRYALDAPHYPRTEHPGTELGQGLGAAYQWARGTRDEKIGLGGTTGAFFQYGLYGPDSSNRVSYVGRRGPRGSFDEITSCPDWRRALNEGGYRFVVTTPGYDQDQPDHPLPAPFTGWTASDPAATRVLQERLVSVFRLDGPLDPGACR